MSDTTKTEEKTNATQASTGEAPAKTEEHDVQYQDEETKAQVRFRTPKTPYIKSIRSF